MAKCSYGCGQTAIKYFKTVNKWCCQHNAKGCPAIKESQRNTCLKKYGVDLERLIPEKSGEE